MTLAIRNLEVVMPDWSTYTEFLSIYDEKTKSFVNCNSPFSEIL